VLLGLSLAYAAGYLLLRMRAPEGREPAEPEGPGRWAALSMLAGGLGAVAAGGAAGWTLGAGLAAATVAFRAPVRAGPGGAALRSASAVLLGVVLATLAGPADALLRGAAGGTPFPESWFVLAAEAGAGWASAGVLVVAAGSAAGGWALGRLGGGIGVAAPGWILLLGPAHPVRGAAAALAAAALTRIGASPSTSAALALALAVAPAALALR